MKAKIILSTIALLCFGFVATAQGLKIGFTSAEYIMSLMPEMMQIDSDVTDYGAQLDQQLKTKTQAFQQQVQTYQQSMNTMTEEARGTKEQELTKMQQEVQKFEQDVQAAYSRKLQELLEPVQTRVYNAINDVAAENNYTHILAESAGQAGPILLYSQENDPFTDLVLVKLGVTPPAKPAN
ncbi:OmpH family outer membrane protein [Algoriphagus aquimarinus]|uniref:OmpH family outer membrane protein n=1 Tax=Algoriphagus aquimarinus TaxID=237018 RepID=UPI0030DB18B6|tara:strand:- start:141 stop:683 length:543 start_codon:yes stop_codon:yes gene_type:complete